MQERNSYFGLLLKMPTMAGIELKPESGARNAIQVSYTGGRNPIIWAIIAAFQGMH